MEGKGCVRMGYGMLIFIEHLFCAKLYLKSFPLAVSFNFYMTIYGLVMVNHLQFTEKGKKAQGQEAVCSTGVLETGFFPG